jgi:hypothetical protein
VYLQPAPAVLHPDPRVSTAHGQYTELDSNQEMRCPKGSTVAFSVGFGVTLSLTSLKIIFMDSLRANGKVLHVPDVELSLTGGRNLQSTGRRSILEILLGIGAGFAR